jgi:hypothetical protein
MRLCAAHGGVINKKLVATFAAGPLRPCEPLGLAVAAFGIFI